MPLRPLKTNHHSIRSIGLEKYLNDTRGDHNGFNYSGFLNMLEAKVGTAPMARAFNVSRMTMDKWIGIHIIEQANRPPKL